MAAFMQQELRMWMSENNLPQHPMGYNEIVDSAHAQSVSLRQRRCNKSGRIMPCWAAGASQDLPQRLRFRRAGTALLTVS
eukprot:m.316771 g.316771  ORF g.316771 m.316771 type:complete len:80 (-) comp16428_c0_seq2:2205-2444(-)